MRFCRDALMWLVVFLALDSIACRVPPPGTLAGRVISCTTEAVRTQWPTVVAPVNDCLALPDGSDWRGCLDVIVRTTKVGIDVVACVVKGQGERFAAAAATNPDDVRSSRAAGRARAYTEGVKFEGEGP